MLLDPRCLTQSRGVYVVEDLHVMEMCDRGFCQQPSDIWSIFGRAMQKMYQKTPSGMGLVSMEVYIGMAFLHVGTQEKEVRLTRGEDGFSEGAMIYNPEGTYDPSTW
eukprot:CAMPEP_0178420632 /NCGR_PEP_ID=MMETSP0689_2-20121128/26233_1 /TAXON_ID=160604 /ORGANISM="Amphidinium massartii, Strain CS-259" /LENGTH=106 /DNA_ID=CAMNT_0020042121 /DNA_START=111 /DNA_END=428 /DNA_ORIENTATION=-